MVKTSSEQKPENSLHKTQQQQLKGVRMRKWGKWVAEVRMPNSRGKIWLGSYNTSQQAARAYDCAVYCLRGCEAKFNFPDSLPEIPSALTLTPSQIQAAAAKFAVEEFRQPLEKDAAFSETESQSRIESHQNLEEEDWTVLLSLLQEVENSLCLNLNDFPVVEEAPQDIH